MPDHKDFLAMVSTEFHRYLMENEAFGEKLPVNAMVIFEIEGEDDFNRWHKETSLKNHEPNQPVVVVHVKKWRQHSSIEELHLAEATTELESSSGSIPAA
jgi:hypothetical protein